MKPGLVRDIGQDGQSVFFEHRRRRNKTVWIHDPSRTLRLFREQIWSTDDRATRRASAHLRLAAASVRPISSLAAVPRAQRPRRGPRGSPALMRRDRQRPQQFRWRPLALASIESHRLSGLR